MFTFSMPKTKVKRKKGRKCYLCGGKMKKATGGQVQEAMRTGYGTSHANVAAGYYGHDPRKENYMTSPLTGIQTHQNRIGYPMVQDGGGLRFKKTTSSLGPRHLVSFARGPMGNFRGGPETVPYRREYNDGYSYVMDEFSDSGEVSPYSTYDPEVMSVFLHKRNPVNYNLWQEQKALHHGANRARYLLNQPNTLPMATVVGKKLNTGYQAGGQLPVALNPYAIANIGSRFQDGGMVMPGGQEEAQGMGSGMSMMPQSGQQDQVMQIAMLVARGDERAKQIVAQMPPEMQQQVLTMAQQIMQRQQAGMAQEQDPSGMHAQQLADQVAMQLGGMMSQRRMKPRRKKYTTRKPKMKLGGMYDNRGIL